MSNESRVRRAARLFRPAPRDEVEEELTFHLEARAREYEAQGMAPDAARAAAAARLGSLGGVRAECEALLVAERGAESRRDWLGDARQDVHFALRSALRAPLFALLAVVTLALGIGANAAVFGVVKSVLLDALPYPAPDRLVRVHGSWTDGSFDNFTLSAGSARDIAVRQASFEHVGASAGGPSDAFFSAGQGAGAGAGVDIVPVLWVEPGHLAALGVAPALGRGFLAGDVQDTAQVIMLSHAAWQQRFGGERDVLGRTVRINDIPRTVVGVMPRGFMAPAGSAEVFLPLSLEPTLRDAVRARGSHWLWVYGRLRPGVTLDAARAEVAVIGVELAAAYPRDNESIRFAVVPVRDVLVGDTRTPLLLVMASAGLVLLIACANLAGALLSRTIARREEFAVRVSLGAGRGRLVRQLLTESTLLAVAGGAAGLLLASAGMGVLRRVAAPALPQHVDLSLDGGAVLVTFLLALLTGLAFGLAPALAVSRTAPHGSLRDAPRGSSEGRRARRLRGALVAGQVALCLSLLAGAGLLGRSLWAMAATPHGYDPDGVLVVTAPLPNARYGTAEERLVYFEEFGDRLRALPGVTDVAFASDLPTRMGNRDGLTIQGRPWPAGAQTPFILASSVSSDYFRTMGIPLRAGRIFGPGDHIDAPLVIVISETMARRYWPNGDAVGARVRLGPNPESEWIEVIGVVGDVRHDLAQSHADPMLYYSLEQAPWGSTALIRATGDPATLVGAVRRELAGYDAAVPIREAITLRAVIGEGLTQRRLPALLLAGFGALALLLAAVGVYAMFANMAAAREREFGVRVALGSSRGAIAALVLRQGAAYMAAGLAVGVAGVVLVTRLLRSLLFDSAALDLVALGAAVAALLLCAIVAMLVPVRRATRADPRAVLR